MYFILTAHVGFDWLHVKGSVALCGQWMPSWIAQCWLFEGRSGTFASGFSEGAQFVVQDRYLDIS